MLCSGVKLGLPFEVNRWNLDRFQFYPTEAGQSNCVYFHVHQEKEGHARKGQIEREVYSPHYAIKWFDSRACRP